MTRRADAGRSPVTLVQLMTRRRSTCPGRPRAPPPSSEHSADDVVRETGWVFNNVTGDELNLAEFVETGDHEIRCLPRRRSGCAPTTPAPQTLVEIGSGIGRMTASFTRMFGKVVACDLDAAFLERCRETVAQFGTARAAADQPRRRRPHAATCPTTSADLVFSYITLQHCHHDDALGARRARRCGSPSRAGTSPSTSAPGCRSDMRAVAGRQDRRGPRGACPRVGPVHRPAASAGPPRLAGEPAAPRRGAGRRRRPSLDRRPASSARRSVAPFARRRRPPTTCSSGVHRSHWWLVATVR